MAAVDTQTPSRESRLREEVARLRQRVAELEHATTANSVSSMQKLIDETLIESQSRYRSLILDAPIPPQEKAKPARAVICIVSTLLAFLISLAVAWQLERAAQLADRDPEQYAQLEKFLAGLGLRFLLPRR